MALPVSEPAPPPVTGDPVAGRRPRRRRRPGRGPAMLLIAAAGISVLGIGLFQAGAGLGGGRTGIVGATASPGPGVANPSLDPAGSPGASAGSSAAPQPSAPAGGPTPGTPSTAERRHAVLGVRLQAELDRVRAKLAIPGASVAITFPDGWTWSGSSGLADIAAKTPVTPNTAFAYASISKTFTSALILQLVDAGALRLTDSAAGLLPPLRLAIDRRITVAMLLDHTSGLADYFLNPKIDRPLQARPNATWTVDQALRYVGKRLAPPGKAWHYSNTNYLLLGLIAERVTGQPLATAIRTRLLDPNGLAATWSQPDETARLPLAHGYRFNGTKLTAKAIDLADGSGIAPFRSVVTAAGGAGSMAGTTGDLVTWARALYGGRVLGPTGTAMLLSGFTKTTAYLPGVAYGYGIQALSIDGHASLGHSGRLLGFRGAVRHFPIDGLTIAVLTNQSRADAGVLVQALLAVALPTAPACPACPTAR